jgi:general secretion pathway protein D
VPTPVNLGNGQLGTALNIQQVETSLVAQDGETVVVGGLIQQTDQKNENKVPCLGDLPYIGAAFRFRTQQRIKRELIVILTPHVVRSQADADRIVCEEKQRMDWLLSDVNRFHGPADLYKIMPGAGPGGECGPGGKGACSVGTGPGGPTAPQIPYGPLLPMTANGGPAAAAPAVPPPGTPMTPAPLPPPAAIPVTPPVPPPPAAAPAGPSGEQQAGPPLTPVSYTAPAQPQYTAPGQPQQPPAPPAAENQPPQGKESRGWKLLRRD